MNEQKVKQVAHLTELLQQYAAVLVVNYSGLNVFQSQELRSKLTAVGSTMFVARNTLMAIAADQTERTELKELLGGQVAFIFADQSDVPAGAKALLAAIKEQELSVEVVGGLLEKAVLTPAQITALSKLPSREVLLTQLVYMLSNPVRNLASVLNNTVASIAIVLNAVAQKSATPEPPKPKAEEKPDAPPADDSPPEAASETADEAEAEPKSEAESEPESQSEQTESAEAEKSADAGDEAPAEVADEPEPKAETETAEADETKAETK